MVAGEEEPIEFSADTEVYGWLISQCREVTEAKGLDYLRSHGISTDDREKAFTTLKTGAKAVKIPPKTNLWPKTHPQTSPNILSAETQGCS